MRPSGDDLRSAHSVLAGILRDVFDRNETDNFARVRLPRSSVLEFKIGAMLDQSDRPKQDGERDRCTGSAVALCGRPLRAFISLRFRAV